MKLSDGEKLQLKMMLPTWLYQKVHGYITDAEHDLLASDGAAVKRLEDYDAAKAQVAAAYLRAAEMCRFAARGTVEAMSQSDKSETWKIIAQQSVEQYESCASNIERLTPADAERSLQVYAQERVVEEAAWWSEGYHRANGWPSCPKCERLAAATAQLAELRNTKASGVKL